MAFLRHTVTFTLVALVVSGVTHLSDAPDCAPTHTLLSAPFTAIKPGSTVTTSVRAAALTASRVQVSASYGSSETAGLRSAPRVQIHPLCRLFHPSLMSPLITCSRRPLNTCSVRCLQTRQRNSRNLSFAFQKQVWTLLRSLAHLHANSVA